MMAAIYLKATRLASVSSTVGEIVTMQSNDAFRVMEGVRWFYFLPTATIVVASTNSPLPLNAYSFGGFHSLFEVVLVLVCLVVGPVPGIVGVLILVGLFLPSQIMIGRYVQRQRHLIAGITDIRIRLYEVVLLKSCRGIRVDEV